MIQPPGFPGGFFLPYPRPFSSEAGEGPGMKGRMVTLRKSLYKKSLWVHAIVSPKRPADFYPVQY